MTQDSQSEERRAHWDRRHAAVGIEDDVEPYPLFADHQHLFPDSGTALEIACGRGRGSVWLAKRGLVVDAVDFSPVAVEMATDYAAAHGVAGRCNVRVHDLNEGLPSGPQADVVVCYLFRDPSLDASMIDRVRRGGLLAIAVLSEVGAGPGRFRAAQGELSRAFSKLDILASGEADGYAWLIGQRTSSA